MRRKAQHEHLKHRAMTAKMLIFTVFCCVSGGPFGLEPLVKESGPGLALLLIAITPLIWALPDALTSCELAPAIPEEGGYIIWVKRAMGPFAGFLNAWWTWLYTLVDAAIYPVMFATYLTGLAKYYFGVQIWEHSVVQWMIALVVVAIFTGINIRGTRHVGRTSTIFALLIIIPFAAMVIIGGIKMLFDPRPIVTSLLPQGESLTGALTGGLGIVMWNYLGWDALSTIAEEVEDPAKAYPRALLTSLGLVTAIYLLPTFVGLAFFPDASAWIEGVWPEVARATGGEVLAVLMSVAALVSPMALFTASLLASSRVPLVLAEDRFLPKALMDIHPEWGTPWKALLLSGVVYVFLTYKTFQELVVLNVILYSAALVLETLALIVLRYKEPDLPRPFKIPGGLPILIVIFILPVSMIGVLTALSIQEDGWLAQWQSIAAILSGPLIYGAIKLYRRLTG